MTTEQMTIFTRTYDFISWLIPKTASFPRSQRFIVTKRLQDAALNFQEFIIEANRQRGRMRLDRLRYADAALDKVRLYLRLAVRWQWLTEGQYHHVSRMVKELDGRGMKDGATGSLAESRIIRCGPGEYRTGPAPGRCALGRATYKVKP